jgi:hypothetical protein
MVSDQDQESGQEFEYFNYNELFPTHKIYCGENQQGHEESSFMFGCCLVRSTFFTGTLFLN